jgi:cell division protein FtsI (penicillin-binding protein 3)
MMIDDPKGSKTSFGFRTAGMTIAPATSRLITKIAPILGIAPEATRDVDLSAVAAKAPEAVEE